MIVKAIRTGFQKTEYDKGLENLLNEIGYENVLQVLPCYCGGGQYFYTIIYRGTEDE